MSDMPERIYVDAEGKDTEWFTINHLREVNPDDVVIRYAWTEEYVRADKYAELEAQNKQLGQLVRSAPWVKTHAGSSWYKRAQKVIDMVEKDDE